MMAERLAASVTHDLLVGATSFAGRVGVPISFFVALSNGTNLTGRSVHWDWGDGTTSNLLGPSATRTYASPGLYELYAKVTDPFGVTHDNWANLLALPVSTTHANDPQGTALQLDGRVVANSTSTDGATALVAPGQTVTLEVGLTEPVHAARVASATPSTSIPSSLSLYATFPALYGDPQTGTSGQLQVYSGAPAGDYAINFTVNVTAVLDNASLALSATFSFTVVIGTGQGGGAVGSPHSSSPGSLTSYEYGVGGPGSFDPAIVYDSLGLEVIENVYQTLIGVNGTATGSAAASFVPLLATCVPGSSLCQSLYSNSLVSGSHYTFVLSSSPRFYDASTGASWPVYPTDVLFSIARTLAFSTQPCFGCNNGWELAQALLSSGNGVWDGGIHGARNNTPSNVYASMTVNDSTYCPSSLLRQNGCITFNANGQGSSWPFFLQLVANPLGGSVVPCGWFSAATQGAGIPYWTAGNVSGHGDSPCLTPGASGFGVAPSSLTATAWDSWETAASSPPFVGNVQYAMAGSGPYALKSEDNAGYSLSSNTHFVANPACTFAGCPNATGRFGNVTVIYQTSTATGLSAVEAGGADLAVVAPGDGTRVANDSGLGLVVPHSSPSLQFNFQAFNLAYNETLFHGLTGLTTTAPSGVLTDVNLRQFLLQARPHATIEKNVYTENGTQWRFPYGGPPIPLYSGSSLPSNVSWPSGDPVSSAKVVGSAGWWWNLTSHDSTTGTTCTTVAPCSIPLVYSQNDTQTQSEDTVWASSVSNLSGGAVTLTPVAVPFLTLVIYSILTSPGNAPWGIYAFGWIDDYPDPSDPVGATMLPQSQYGYPDSLYPALHPLNTSCTTSLTSWSSRSTPIPYGCQGAAYDAMVNAFSAETNAALGPSRDLAYAEGVQVAERLGLYAAAGQLNAETVLAPWVDPASVNANPWLGGASQVWYTIRDRPNPALPLTLRGVFAAPSSLAQGQLLTLTAVPSGGTGGRVYAWSGLPPGCAGTSAQLSCHPTGGGNFTVTVTVTDAAGGRATGHVTIHVSGLAIASFVASPSTITLGGSTAFTVTLGGSSSGAHYAYSSLPTGCTSQDAASLPCTPTATGTFTVQVRVTLGSASATDTTPLTVVPKPFGIGGFVASRAAIDLGDSVTLTVNGSANSGPYTAAFTGVPGCVVSVPVSTTTGNWSATTTCTPAATGTFVVNATVTNSVGQNGSALTGLTVNALPSISSIALGSSAVEVAIPLTLLGVVTGGTAPFTFSYAGLPVGCVSMNTTNLTCTPTAGGTSVVTFKVLDAAGRRTSAQLTVAVQAALTIAFFSAVPDTVATGGATNLTLRVTGGTAPMTIVYAGLPASCPGANATAVECIPTAPGKFIVTVTITDRAGAIATQATTLNVTAATAPAGPGPAVFGIPLLVFVAAMAIVVAAAIAVVWLVRRNPPPAAEESPPAEPEYDDAQPPA